MTELCYYFCDSLYRNTMVIVKCLNCAFVDIVAIIYMEKDHTKAWVSSINEHKNDKF